MTVLTEGRHDAEFIVSEAPNYLSREVAPLAAGESVEPGGIIALMHADAEASASADAGNTGNGVMTLAAPPVTGAVRPGVYTVSCIEPVADAGTFRVERPDGSLVGIAQVGVAFAKEVKFTIADGATNFAAGDTFRISVGGSAGAAIPWDPDATDGSEVPTGFAIFRTAAPEGSSVKMTYLARLAQVRASGIVWPAGVTDAQKASALEALKALHLVAR